jgi:DNA-binding IclR family transcriptional regulator
MILGKIYEKNTSLITAAQPLLKELASITKEATSLFVSDGLQLLRLLREEGQSLIRFSINENHDLPAELYALAAGKIFLAYIGNELLNRLFDKKILHKFTPNTITDWEELNKECKKILAQGYAISNGEHFIEVGAVAMPVFDAEGEICATIDIAGPIQRFSKKRIKNELLAPLKKTVKELSIQLGYVGNRFDE